MRRIVLYGWRLPLAVLAGMVVAWMDVWFIKAYIGIDAAGVYAWAYAVYNLATIVLIALSAVLTPKLIDMHLAAEPARVAIGLSDIAAVVALAIGLTPLLLGFVRFVGLALPANYVDAMVPLVLLMAATGFLLLSYAVSPLIMADERLVGAMVLINITVALLNAGGDFFLVPHYAGAGAAFAKLIAMSAGAMLFYLLAFRKAEIAKTGALRRIAWLVLSALYLFPLAVLLAKLSAFAALFTGGVGSLILLGVMRWAGLLRRLEGLMPHLALLPAGPRRPIFVLIAWLTGPRDRVGTKP